MHRTLLIASLYHHTPADAHEYRMRDQIIGFIEKNPNCFERTLLIGHITGSAFIINKRKTHTLMTHHQKLDKWLQLGGHSDGESNTIMVALRESMEESGLNTIKSVSEDIFDVDIHEIPARKNEPAHVHYDIRYLFEADESEKLILTHESKDLQWIPLDQMVKYTTEESVMRMVRKIIRQ